MSNNYSVQYNINVSLYQSSVKPTDRSIQKVGNEFINSQINISSDDIISIAVIHNFDGALYPIIRVRLYADLSVMEKIAQVPDDLYILINFDGTVYDTSPNDDGSTNVKKISAKDVSFLQFAGKVYIENKNIPTSVADDYEQGIKKSDDLNVNRKVPITLFCYDHEMVHFMIQKVNSIFKDMDLTSIIESIFRKQGAVSVDMDPIINQIKYDQVLFPNLTVTEALSFIEAKYGLYPKGAIIYGDTRLGEGDLYIHNSDVDNIDRHSRPIAIHVQSYKDDSDMGGLRWNLGYNHFNVKAENVSLTTISDIERVLNAEQVNAINVNTLEIGTTKMTKLFNEANKELAFRTEDDITDEAYFKLIRQKIITPDILHKSKNKYIADLYNARITERITRVDVSGTGFNAFLMDVKARYNIIFDTPIRGMNVNQFYRAKQVIHTFTNTGGGLFTVQTTASLCSN